MRAYKFLRARVLPDGTERFVGPYSGFAWSPGEEVAVAGTPAPGGAGISACRLADLPYWIRETLWVVELSGEVVEGDRKLVAGRGCLLERVEAWAPAAMEAFAVQCVRRLRDRAAALVRAAGFDGPADELAGCDAVADLYDVAVRCGRAVADDETHDLVRLVLFAGDAAEAAAAGRTALAGYVAAHGMQHAAANVDRRSSPDVDAYLVERGLQVDWFARNLGLS